MSKSYFSQDDASYNQQIATLSHENTILKLEIAAMRQSISWRITRPLRCIFNISFWGKFCKSSKLELYPLQQIEVLESGEGYIAIGDNPQFLLNIQNKFAVKDKWVELSYFFKCEQEEGIHQLYIDVGNGFEPDLVLTYDVSPGLIKKVLFLPEQTVGLRLDSSPVSCSFQIRMPLLQRVQPLNGELIDRSSDSAVLWNLLGHNAGSGDFSSIVNATRKLFDSYYWLSENDDPHVEINLCNQDIENSGWYVFDLQIMQPSKRGKAKIYIDYGEGFSENHVEAIPFESDVHVKKIAYLGSGVSKIRFDPVDKKTMFSIKHFSYVQISVKEAENVMFDALMAEVHDNILDTDMKAYIELHAEKNEVDYFTQMSDDYNALFDSNSGVAYTAWISEIEPKLMPSSLFVEQVLAQAEVYPLVSIVMPTYNTDPILLKQAIDSVMRQSYSFWELCIADDFSSQEHVREILTSYADMDSRIKVVYREKNGHISVASNSALAMASGDFVALMDHDDVLADHALFCIFERIVELPDVQILYSDEDKLDLKGRRFDPHFKSDWNPDLFFSQNYISHLGVYRRNLLVKIDGFREGYEGSQDYDLFLRCLPHINAEQIVHVPKVLYHWRMVEGSTALAPEEKNYTTGAGIKSLQDYMDETCKKGVVVEQATSANTYKVNYPLASSMPLVSLLIPCKDRWELTEICVRSILDKTTYSNYEIIILDNGSVEPETHEFFEQIQSEDSRVTVLCYDYPFNYSAINNWGVEQTKGALIGLVNNDIEVISPDWLSEMVSHAWRKDIGCVGAKLYYENETIQHAGVILGIGGVAGHSHKYLDRYEQGYFSRVTLVQNVSAVTAACLLVRREVYEEVGGLDDVNLTIAFNDVDFCLKIREAGYRNLFTPYAELYHYESISRGTEDSPEKQERFNKEVHFMQKKWGRKLQFDPYYNPNLTSSKEDFSLDEVCC